MKKKEHDKKMAHVKIKSTQNVRNCQKRYKEAINELWTNDIPRTLKTTPIEKKISSTNLMCRPYIEIFHFLSTVCKDLNVQYPNIANDKSYVIRLFTRALAESSNHTKKNQGSASDPQ